MNIYLYLHLLKCYCLAKLYFFQLLRKVSHILINFGTGYIRIDLSSGNASMS